MTYFPSGMENGTYGSFEPHSEGSLTLCAHVHVTYRDVVSNILHGKKGSPPFLPLPGTDER